MKGGTPTPIEAEVIQALDEAADRLIFLSEVGRVLSSALTDRECFFRLMQLVVPSLADGATLAIVDEQGKIKRVAFAHVDKDKEKILAALGSDYFIQLNDIIGPSSTIKRKEAQLISNINAYLEIHPNEIRSPKMKDIVRKLDIHSWISTPIIVGQQILGSLNLSTSNSDSGREFTENDLKLSQEVAARAAYTAFHLIRYSRTTRKLEKMEIQVGVREKYLSQIRQDVLSALTVVMLSTQMLETTQDPGKKNEYAGRIVGSVKKIVDVIKNTPEIGPSHPIKAA